MTNESRETRVTTDELNRALHLARGLCWHEWNMPSKDVLEGGRCKCGLPHFEIDTYDGAVVDDNSNPDYTSNLDAAFELVEWMKGKGFDFELIGNSGQVWIVEIAKDDGQPTFTTHTSLPTAIATACYAALREGKVNGWLVI